MDYKQANHVANRRPSLPRLRNKASLGRLQVFGGVLDFDGGNPASGIDSNMNIPPLPILSHIYSTLAGPVSASSSAIQTCTPTQSHNKQHSTREEEHDEDEVIRTPVKNTNSLSTLKRLKALNKDSKYPDSLSNGLPQSNSSSTIPGLDFDHPLLQSQSEISHKQVDRHNIEQDHLHSRHIIHSRPSSVSLHSRESSLDSFSDESPDVNVVLERRKGKLPTRNRSHSHREREAEEKEKERLVNEIKQDMDEGGYASLEQVGVLPYLTLSLQL